MTISFNADLFIPAFFVLLFFFLYTVISSTFAFICSCTSFSISSGVSKREHCSSICSSVTWGVCSLLEPNIILFNELFSNFRFSFSNSKICIFFSASSGSSAIYLINIVEEPFVLINRSYIFHT